MVLGLHGFVLLDPRSEGFQGIRCNDVIWQGVPHPNCRWEEGFLKGKHAAIRDYASLLVPSSVGPKVL
jgi:hypothetical protein